VEHYECKLYDLEYGDNSGKQKKRETHRIRPGI
jgi:hypothetical protein